MGQRESNVQFVQPCHSVEFDVCTLHTIQTYSISWGEDYLIILEIFNTMFGYVFISEFEKIL